ncbi:hypothetical protein [Marinoscillum sp.]|uniref:hypothetical protein n=1 Tax=Marinoscillum sp. TaxID=2024838 RepID=UPI003BA9E2AD
MISEEQVDFIAEEIRKAHVKSVELRDDLIDHMCCLVEIEMGRGVSFEEAYGRAFNQTSPNGYGEIQRETVFLLNYNKIMNMKRFTYISGFVFALSLTAGTFFKLLHLPGASGLLSVGMCGMLFVFLPMLIVIRYKQLAVQVLSERLKWIFGVLSFVLFMVALWMKLTHLMGAGVILGLSFFVFGFGFLPFLFFRMYKASTDQP